MRALLLLALATAPSCIAPSVIDSSGRAVPVEAAQLTWRPAQPADLAGLFESIAIEGEAAASISRIYYHFSADGHYTGAALVIGGPQPEFQTLSGTWTISDGQLDLGDGQSVAAEYAPEHLRLVSEGGVATLRRAAVE